MESKLLIERFWYLGNFRPAYIIRHGQIENFVVKIATLLQDIDGDSFVGMVEKFLKHSDLMRKDELWYTYAAYLANDIPEKCKNIAKNAFSRLAKSADDLFLFVRYSKLIQETHQRCGFSKTTKKAITMWYKEQDGQNLVDMWATSSGNYGFRHKDIISLCHINTEELRTDKLLIGLTHKPTSVYKDKIMDIDKRSTNELKIIYDLSKFKATGDLSIASSLVKAKRLKFENVPAHMLKKIDVWNTLMPILTYRQLLSNIHYLVDRKMLDNIVFSKAYLKALDRSDAIATENIHPITILIQKNQLEMNRRYSEVIKQNYYAKKFRPIDVKPNPYINKKICKIFDNCFDNLSENGIRTFITIKLQKNTKRQCVLNHKQINCFDAALTLAFSYFKREPKSVVYTYINDNSIIKELDWKRNWKYSKLSETCTNLLIPKCVQRLLFPISEALNKTEIYDLFLIVVPTATHGNPKNKSESVARLLSTYRAVKNPNAKLVIVNLRRSKPAMRYEDTGQNENILEICGFDENIPKIINGFVNNLFS